MLSAGIPPYNAWREFCGLPKAYAFDDLKDVMRAEVVERLKTVYGLVKLRLGSKREVSLKELLLLVDRSMTLIW